MSALLIVPILLPLVAGFILPKGNRKARNVFITISLVLTALSSIAVAIYCKGTFNIIVLAKGLTLALTADGVSLFFVVICSLAWLLVALFSFEYMTHEDNEIRFYRFYLFSLSSLIGICFAANLPTLYMFYEAMTLLTVVLVIHSGTTESMAAGIKYLGFSIFGAALALFGLFVIYKYGGAESFAPGGMLSGIPGKTAVIAYFLMMVGFGCKAGMLPLHAWLPTAHPVAPAPASAVLSGVITKMGILATIRLSYFVFPMELIIGTWAQKALLTLALCTVFMGSMLACKEKLLKKRLAWSTVSQASYVVFGIVCLSPMSFEGAFLQVFFHSCAKNALFCCAGAIILKTGVTKVEELGGMGRRMPVVMTCFTIASLSLVGIPPTGGFISKWNLALGAFSSNVGAFAVVGVSVLLISAVLTAWYLLTIVFAAFFPQKDTAEIAVSSAEPKKITLVPLAVFSSALIIFGAFSQPLSEFIRGIVGTIF